MITYHALVIYSQIPKIMPTIILSWHNNMNAGMKKPKKIKQEQEMIRFDGKVIKSITTSSISIFMIY